MCGIENKVSGAYQKGSDTTRIIKVNVPHDSYFSKIKQYFVKKFPGNGNTYRRNYNR